MDYYALIHKYIPADSETYTFYLPHVTLVTKKALEIGRSLELSEESLRFIEEASMLHDIGICRVNVPDIGCHGTLTHIEHGTEGRKILESENLPKHALVCERHTGVGLDEAEIISRNLPLPHRDMNPISIEEKVICYADLFFSKNPESIWIEKTEAEVLETIKKYGENNHKKFLNLSEILRQ